MIPPDRKIKACLVGAGVWGRQHARVFSQRPDVQLCAVAGRTLAKTQARAAEFGLRPYTNVQEMLATEKPDLVSLSLPNLEHFEATMQVIETGYSLLVEKPLTFDLSEADQLLARPKSEVCSLQSTLITATRNLSGSLVKQSKRVAVVILLMRPGGSAAKPM